ncbi:SPOR domain-containing protein [Ruegeria sp. PrR005]|uniref:SPOR domain-containing protein n=1 Tax=Ruegeria sp. PrR005 TaxID=2706882 RepID=A0A6B2NV62_9RHOB|nr:SPOR domain-containing protein [Ruegeria sp. PrR005]NDW46980.1 SPOR domain-containing protein [Ruegeria sp. PrR005]
MRVTRIIAVSVIGLSIGFSSLNAQTLRVATPPAEYPPASYKGKQYVDSRGCIFIRAGIDGNVTWVPRVSRERKQVCGFQPTAVAGSTTSAPRQAAPELITLDQPSTATASAPPPKPKTAKAQPQVRTVAAPAPRSAPQAAKPVAVKPVVVPSTRTTTARPVPVPVAPVTTSTPSQVTPRTVAPTAASTSNGGCPDASALSQRYINQTGVRCGPQPEPPITYGPLRKNSSLDTGKPGSGKTGVPVSLETRIVPKHVYDKRQNTTNVVVPAGYRSVWADDRLNPHRAERTLRPAIIQSTYVTPQGFRPVDRKDGRLNPMRGVRTAEGDAQMNALWSNDLPRTLLPVDTAPRTITVTHSERSYRSIAKPPSHIRLSTRNAPGAVYQPTQTPKRPSR